MVFRFLIAAAELNRKAYGFEIKKEFVDGYNEKLDSAVQPNLLTYS